MLQRCPETGAKYEDDPFGMAPMNARIAKGDFHKVRDPIEVQKDVAKMFTAILMLMASIGGIFLVAFGLL